MRMKPDELSVTYVQDGVEKIHEVARVVIASSSSWATVAHLFQERDPQTLQLRAAKVAIRRYRKKAGTYVVDKHFVLSSGRQAMAFASAITGWFATGEHATPATQQPSEDDDAGDR